MRKSAETLSLPQTYNVDAHASVKRIAKAAAELSARHAAQFVRLTALARSIQKYLPASKAKRSDCVQLARTLVDHAEQYRERADMEDIAFSIIATDSRYLLDDEARAAFLGKPDSR